MNIFVVLIILNFGGNFYCQASNLFVSSPSCGPGLWTLYKDSKCLKFIDQFLNYDEARSACAKLIDTSYPDVLLTIKSKDEQNFLQDFLYESLQLVDNIWLGLRRQIPTGSQTIDEKVEKFVWDDGSLPDFTNWHPESPSADLNKNCTQITSKYSKEDLNGLWTDTSCMKRNLVICQKPAVWSLMDIQKEFLLLRDEVEKKSQSLTQLTLAHEKLQMDTQKFQEAVNKNPVPIGFLYTELPGQSAPSQIWPQVTWSEVSGNFAGDFFRVVGGNSGAFGISQGSSFPKMSRVETVRVGEGSLPSGTNLPESGWSSVILTGDLDGKMDTAIKFHVQNNEIRPANKAVRLWKRTA